MGGETSFLQRLAQLTGADIAASDDLTGNSAKGGDWDLEVATADIEAPTAFTAGATEPYSGVLPSPTAKNDSSTTKVGTKVNIQVLNNDSDVDGDRFYISGVTNPTNLRAALSPPSTAQVAIILPG